MINGGCSFDQKQIIVTIFLSNSYGSVMFLVEHCNKIRHSYIITSTRRYLYTMFKRLSLFTVILSGVLLAGCSSQQATSTKSNTGSEQTEKSTKKSTPEKSEKSDQSSSTSSSSNDDNQATNDDNTNSGSNSNSDRNGNNNTGTTNKNNDSTQTNQSSTKSDNNSNNTDTNNNQSSQNQNTAQSSQTGVNITTADQATSFLADKLSTTYDKANTQYVANGKVTWNNVNGYQINIYSKNSDSPVGSYLVPTNGQYFQIW